MRSASVNLQQLIRAVPNNGQRDSQRPISYRISPSLKAELERLAAADKRTLSQYLELALEAHVEQKRKEGKRR